MNYKAERKARNWSTQEVAKLIKYWSVSAINGLENHDHGGFELRSVLDQLYRKVETPGPAPSAVALCEAPAPPEKKKIVAKMRRQIQDLQLQINAISETLNELEK